MAERCSDWRTVRPMQVFVFFIVFVVINIYFLLTLSGDLPCGTNDTKWKDLHVAEDNKGEDNNIEDKISVKFYREVLWKGNNLEHHLEPLFNIMFKYKKQKNAYIVYDFDAKGSSIGEFYNGLITTFLISKLVDRSFLINTDHKCSPASFYRPNLLAWNIAVDKYRYLNSFTHDLRSEHNFWKRFENFDFEEIYNTSVVRILANTEHIVETRRHFKSFDRILFLHLLSDSDVIRLIIKGLLKPTYSVSTAARNITSRCEEHPLICFHAEIPTEKKYEDYRPVWNLLHSYSQNVNGRSPNFFLSINDSGLIEKAKQEFGSNILSVDSGTGMPENQGEFCQILFKEVSLLEILKSCQTLIITDTIIGKYAAHTRNQSSNLFCFTGGSSILRCQRDIVKSDLCWR